jgi:group I intron endonuclease
MSSPQCVIYMYKSPSGKRYIGKTTQKDIRHRKHGYANGDCPYFHKAIRKHKWENFSYEILEEFDDDVTDEFMSDRETHWIEMHDSTNRAFGYNLTKGGEGMTGYKHTDAAKANISKTLTGHKHTDATKAKISDAIKGRKHTDATKAKMKGHIVSAATKAKMSEAQKGRKHTDATKAKMKGHIVSAATRAKLSKPVLATEKKTGKKREFESACAAARTLSDETGKKFCQGAVSGCANKRRKSHHGWTFSHL